MIDDHIVTALKGNSLLSNQIIEKLRDNISKWDSPEWNAETGHALLERLVRIERIIEPAEMTNALQVAALERVISTINDGIEVYVSGRAKVGKTLVAALVAQALRARGLSVQIETDDITDAGEIEDYLVSRMDMLTALERDGTPILVTER